MKRSKHKRQARDLLLKRLDKWGDDKGLGIGKILERMGKGAARLAITSRRGVLVLMVQQVSLLDSYLDLDLVGSQQHQS